MGGRTVERARPVLGGTAMDRRSGIEVGTAGTRRVRRVRRACVAHVGDALADESGHTPVRPQARHSRRTCS